MKNKSEKYTLSTFLTEFLEKRRKKRQKSSEERKKHQAERRLLFKIERYPTLLSQITRRRYDRLRMVKSITLDEKMKINRFTVANYAVRQARLDIIENRLHVIREWFYQFATVSFIVLIEMFYYSYFFYSYFGFFYISLDSAKIFNSLLAIKGFLPVIAILLLYEVLFNFVASKITFTQRIILILAILFSGMYYLSLPSVGFRMSVFGIVGIEIIRSVSIIIDTIILFGFELYAMNKMPDAVVTNNILLVLNEIDFDVDENKDDSYLFVSTKQYMLTRLEYAADCLENYFHPLLKTSSRASNEWNKEQTKQIANALRAKKKLIVLSKADTRKKLRRSLIDFLIHFRNDEWGELERLTLPQKSWRDNLKIQVPIISRNLVFGLLPLVILWFIQYFKIVAGVSDSIYGAAVIWAIINVLWLDPSLKEKINAMKDASATFKN